MPMKNDLGYFDVFHDMVDGDDVVVSLILSPPFLAIGFKSDQILSPNNRFIK